MRREVEGVSGTARAAATDDRGDRGLAAAFRALEETYRDLDAVLDRERPLCRLRGLCCEFERVGHRLFASVLEIAYARSRFDGPVPAPAAPGRCPFHQGRVCVAREGRPLLCRVYFCDPSFAERMPFLAERFHERVRRIHEEHGLEYRYVSFPEAVAAEPGRGE